MKKYSRELTIDLLKRAREGVAGELSKAFSGEEALGDIEQLKNILSDLDAMTKSLTLMPSERVEAPGLWRVIVDMWPLKDPLGELIVTAEMAYEYQLSVLSKRE